MLAPHAVVPLMESYTMVINYPSSINCPLEVFIPLVTVELKLQGFHTFYDTIASTQCIDAMNKKQLNLRIEEGRLEKLKKHAELKKKTMTQLIEDWIDRLPKSEEGD
jgi:hypothetical protein